MANDVAAPASDRERTVPRWMSCLRALAMAAMAAATAACVDDTAAPAVAPTPSVASGASDLASGTAPAAVDAPAIVLSRTDTRLRVQLDELAYAPLAQDALNDGDEAAWRQALPAAFTAHVHTETGGVCEGGDRVSRYQDDDARNVVELRACIAGHAHAFLAGFTFTDGVVAFNRGLTPGASLATTLAALGIAETAAAPAETLRSIDVVNAEHNSTLRLRFDDAGRLRQLVHEPYTG